MDEREWLAERFQEHRPRLRAVAYRMLGSTSEADDAVQEARIRLSRSNASDIDNLEAWLVTTVGRVALNMLRSRKMRREEPLDARLPDPIVDRADGIDPEHEALLADAVGLALLVVLEVLTPAERLAYVLHDMFSVPFEEIGAMLDRSPEEARQLASRGRRIRGAGTTGKLADRGLTLPGHGGDLGIREGERLAEHEHRAFQRRQRSEHDQQRNRHRLRKLHAVRRVRAGQERRWQPRPDVPLALHARRAQVIQAQPRYHRREVGPW